VASYSCYPMASWSTRFPVALFIFAFGGIYLKWSMVSSWLVAQKWQKWGVTGTVMRWRVERVALFVSLPDSLTGKTP